jgi:hypothetical protein
MPGVPPINRRPLPPAHASPATSLCSAGAIVGRHGEVRAPVDGTTNQTLPHLPLHPTKLTGLFLFPAELPPRRQDGRSGHRRWPPAPPLAGLLPAPSEHGNRSPGTQGSSPARAWPAPAGGWPKFGRTAAGRPPRGHIAKGRFFPGASAQKYNSNCKVTFLLLVNCVENHRKLRKIQNQFSWILCEVSYNFRYCRLS